MTASGARGRGSIVLGMGKLGGDELNAGSDVDLIYFYDTDDGAAAGANGSSISLHDFLDARRAAHRRRRRSRRSRRPTASCGASICASGPRGAADPS